MATWDDADAAGGAATHAHGPQLMDSPQAQGRHRRQGTKHHMDAGELRLAKRKLREMQGVRDRERGRKVCV